MAKKLISMQSYIHLCGVTFPLDGQLSSFLHHPVLLAWLHCFTPCWLWHHIWSYYRVTKSLPSLCYASWSRSWKWGETWGTSYAHVDSLSHWRINWVWLNGLYCSHLCRESRPCDIMLLILLVGDYGDKSCGTLAGTEHKTEMSCLAMDFGLGRPHHYHHRHLFFSPFWC